MIVLIAHIVVGKPNVITYILILIIILNMMSLLKDAVLKPRSMITQIIVGSAKNAAVNRKEILFPSLNIVASVEPVTSRVQLVVTN